jgi:3-oxoacyl-[acyl-carrier protein] reductase
MKNKKILVTGGSRGIGKSIVFKFAKNNYDAIFTFSSNSKEANKTIKELNSLGLKAEAVQCDFTSHESISKMYQSFEEKKIIFDVLVNNAGWTKYLDDKTLRSLSIDDFQKIIKINLEGVFHNIQLAVPILKNKNSNIINISSIAGYNAVGSNLAYCAAKAGVNSLTKSFAKILGPNTRVNGVAPGLTHTEMTEDGPKEYIENQKMITPLNRIAKPEDISEVVFSIVENMKFINGKTIVVDGGRLN